MPRPHPFFYILRLSVSLFAYLPACLPDYLFACLSVRTSVRASVLSVFCLSFRLPACLSLFLPVRPSVGLSVGPSGQIAYGWRSMCSKADVTDISLVEGTTSDDDTADFEQV